MFLIPHEYFCHEPKYVFVIIDNTLEYTQIKKQVQGRKTKVMSWDEKKHFQSRDNLIVTPLDSE